MTTSSDKPKIVIGMASRGYDVCPHAITFVSHIQKTHDAEFVSQICGFNAVPAQEGVFWRAHEMGADYLLIIDSDVIPIPEVLDKLLECKKDIVVAPVWHYNAVNGQIFVDATKMLDKRVLDIKESGVEEIISASFGCVLISKKVIDTFFDSKQMFVYWSDFLPTEAYPCSSDIIFFLKAKKLGFQAYVCWDAQGSEHYTRIHLSNRVLNQFLKENEDAKAKA